MYKSSTTWSSDRPTSLRDNRPTTRGLLGALTRRPDQEGLPGRSAGEGDGGQQVLSPPQRRRPSIWRYIAMLPTHGDSPPRPGADNAPDVEPSQQDRLARPRRPPTPLPAHRGALGHDPAGRRRTAPRSRGVATRRPAPHPLRSWKHRVPLGPVPRDNRPTAGSRPGHRAGDLWAAPRSSARTVESVPVDHSHPRTVNRAVNKA